ncbi:MAG: ABC transporter ATP-binding protein [Actinobacteria bacterium]|nr:MAG: ABC transporter ATP-binding protein [Actinomycetota bacterium]
MADAAIEVRALRKSYGDVEAVKGIDLTVRVGEVFALLGPNGAGKTTTVEILEGFRDRSGGEARVLGQDPATRDRRLRARIGIVLQSTGIDPYLTVAETIDLFRSYYATPRPVDEVIELVGLTEKRDTRVLKLSGGQQRRLDVGIALAGDPELLFLDEPTTGFDPSARRNAWGVVKNLAELGKTILLTTHYMDEAQVLADRVAVISAGVIVAEGDPASLGGRDTAATLVRFRLPPGQGDVPPSLAEGVSTDDGRVELRTTDPTRTLYELTRWAVERGVVLEGLDVTRPTLEDVYLELTGGEAGHEG